MKTAGATHRACTIDAMGTMVRLLPPWDRFEPPSVAGLPTARVEAAFRKEMAYYAAHATEADDERSLRALRERCAAILSAELGVPIGVESMMEAIRFEAYEDTLPALIELRARGIALACVSNWDFELPQVLATLGLAEHLDAIVPSAQIGVAKPDPAIFESALERLGALPGEALHVGDSDADVAGARSTGMDALLIARGRHAGGGRVPVISSMRQIGEHLRG